jgi:hypothetical protein
LCSKIQSEKLEGRRAGHPVKRGFEMKRLNPTTVVACLALAFSLAGTGYAARDALLPANSVGT